jgi:hypothetical protein
VVLISMSIGHGELLKPLPKMRITDNLWSTVASILMILYL